MINNIKVLHAEEKQKLTESLEAKNKEIDILSNNIISLQNQLSVSAQKLKEDLEKIDLSLDDEELARGDTNFTFKKKIKQKLIWRIYWKTKNVMLNKLKRN